MIYKKKQICAAALCLAIFITGGCSAENGASETTAATTFSETEKTPAETPEMSATAATEAATETTTTTTTETHTTAETTAATTAATTVKTTQTETTTTAAETSTEAVTTAAPREKTVTVNGTEYILTFEDDFNGTTIDKTKWSKCPEWKRQDLNNYWSNDMSYLDGNGNLVIKIAYNDAKSAWLSGGIRSKGKFEQAYGYFEVKCTLNSVPGWWTAFWLEGETVHGEDDSGVDGTEIDVYESALVGKSAVHHGLHWDGYGEAHKSDGFDTSVEGLYEGSHIFALEWTEEWYIFYIDGKETWRSEGGGICENPLYLKITGETGSWTGVPSPNSAVDYAYFDYVRVYSKA